MLYGVYMGTAVGLLLTGSFWSFLQPERICFLSYYSIFRDKLGLPLLVFLSTIFTYFGHLFTFLGEIVPTVFFYHAGCVVEVLEKELKHVSDVVGFETYTGGAAIISNWNAHFKKLNLFR